MQVAPVFKPSRSKYLVFTTDIIIPTLICACVGTLAYTLLYSPIFKVQKVSCLVDYRPCENPSLGAELDKLIGQNIFKLSPARIKARLTSGDFTIRQVEITRRLPSRVEVSLQSVYPHVALQVKDESRWVVLDTQLRVIGSRDTYPNVPIVIVTSPLSLTVGTMPNDQLIIESLQLARKLFDELFTVKSVTLVDTDMLEVELESGLLALFTPKKDVLEQLRSLQAVLTDGTIWKGKSVIDVRFTHPVLR